MATADKDLSSPLNPAEVKVEPPQSSPDEPKAPRGPPTLTCTRCRLATLALLSPLIVVLLFTYWLLGKVFTRRITTTAAFAAALVGVLFLVAMWESDGSVSDFWEAQLTDYSFSGSVFDVVVLFLVACVVVPVTDRRNMKVLFRTAKNPGSVDALWGRQSSVVAVCCAVVIVAFAVAKLVEYDGPTLQPSHKAIVWYLLRHVRSTIHNYRVAGINTLEVLPTPRPFGAPGDGNHVTPLSSQPPPPPDSDTRPALVLVHGYAAGAALFKANLDAFGECGQFSRVLAVDWLGTGLSRRPRFPKSRGPAVAEAWFVDAMEAWRQEMGLRRIVLLGHSLGGILVTSYASRFPDVIHRLVLASPATPKSFVDTRSTFFRIVGWMWDHNVTPMRIVRFMGPLGPLLLRAATNRRYSRAPGGVDKVDAKAIAAYCYHNFAMHGSGEFAMNGVLQKGASARIPISDRLTPDLCRRFPVTFIYGAPGRDWMDHTQGAEIVDTLVTAGCTADISTVPKAGHQLFVDQPEEFTRRVIASCAGAPPTAV